MLAREIWNDLGERVTAFCDFVGTGGTLLGIARALKRRNPRIRCYAIEPASAAILAGHAVTNQNHRIQGGGYSMTVPRWDPTLVDGYVTVTDEEAIHWARELASREGLFAGFSSGANVAGAMKLLDGSQKESAAAHVVFTINDSGLKYLSTDLWP